MLISARILTSFGIPDFRIYEQSWVLAALRRYRPRTPRTIASSQTGLQ